MKLICYFLMIVFVLIFVAIFFENFKNMPIFEFLSGLENSI